MLHRSVLLLGLVIAVRVAGQTTSVTCDSSFGWANNSKGQSPCLVAAYLQAQCFPNKQWDVPALTSGAHYLSPAGTVASCACSSPVYSLLSACAACQGASYISWGEWTSSCPSAYVNNGTFPFQIPSGTIVPSWAMKAISSGASFDINAAQGKESTSLSAAVTFLIVFLPIVLLSLLGFGGWVWWRRRQYRARGGRNAGKEPLLRRYGRSHISIDTESEVHITLVNSAGDSTGPSLNDRRSPQQASPVPTTPDHTPHSAHASPSSPGHQYAAYPETPTYYPHQPYLVPPSAGATSTGFPVSYRTPNPSQSQPPHTGASNNTFATQMQDRSRTSATPEQVEVENDSGTFPRTPVEPQLRSLPLGDPRNLLPPSVRANEPSA